MATKRDAREIIIPTFTQWERVGSVTSILAELEEGNFYTPALLVDQFMRDDGLRGIWDVAMQAVLGAPMHMESAEHSNQRRRKRSDKTTDEAMKLWWKMVPRAELMELCLWGFFLGAGVARKNWSRNPKTYIPTLKTWHSGALRYDVSTDVYMLRTIDQGEIPILPDDHNWVLFTPWGFKYGRLRCYLMSAAMLTLERNWTRRDRARRSEKHGQPFQQLIVPAEASAQSKATAARATASLGTETVSVTPQGEAGNLFDWKFWEPALSASDAFGGTLTEIRQSMAILILGQQTSTMGQGGLGAQDKPGDQQQRNKLRFYAACIGDMGRDNVLADWSEMNRGDRELAPTPCFEIDPPEDMQAKAGAMKTLFEGLALAPADVDKRAVLEDAAIPMVTEEEADAAQVELDAAAQETKDNAKGAADSEDTSAEVA